MALCKRVIARLDIKGSRLIKGIRFEGLRVLGDPCEAALRYAEAGADELLYVDAVASLYGRNGLADLLCRTSREVFIPITAGGGVRCVADAAALLAAGADKIAVNTAALQRPELITELAEAFGSQCVVGSIQARRTGACTWESMAEGGRERTGQEVLAWIEQLQQLGVGEILLTSVDQDGTCAGPDQELQAAAAARASVPLVLGGGFSSVNHVLEALQQPAVAAVSIGAALHRSRLEVAVLKRELADASPKLPIRLAPSSTNRPLVAGIQPLAGKRIGVIDYGMGNQQSLFNALEYLGATTVLSGDPDVLTQCLLLALPGVGAFPKGMAELRLRSLDHFLQSWVKGGRPLLGICLGMQMMLESSVEFELTRGLSLLRGQVIRLPDSNGEGQPLVVPHLGWNLLIPRGAHIDDLTTEALFQYFVHSYVASGLDSENVTFACRYGGQEFIAGFHQGPVAGFQFHPERSGPEGLSLLADVCNKLIAYR